jgi:hypothetical protein
MGNLIRLALMAGTGAGLGGMRRAGLKLAWFVAAAVAIGCLGAAGILCFGVAVFFAIAPKLGPAWAVAIVGLAYALSAAILWLSCRHWYLGRPRPGAALADAAPLGAVAGAEALGGLASGVSNAIERNALTVLLAAFAAGMILNRRR